MRATLFVAALFVMLNTPASANPWPQPNYGGWWNGGSYNNDYDEPFQEDHGPYQRSQGYEGHRTLFGGYEEKLWDGNCKIERHWEADGDYREQRECHHH